MFTCKGSASTRRQSSQVYVVKSPISILYVSIPHSEFCSFGLWSAIASFGPLSGFQFPIRNSVRSDVGSGAHDWGRPIEVSIPHSEFCSFGRPAAHPRCRCWLSFNSPFGILFVRTVARRSRRGARGVSFNSPFGILFVRTSSIGIIARSLMRVSIPHSEFCSFGHVRGFKKHLVEGTVSIPHSEFCSFGRKQDVPENCGQLRFQFPIRNSVRSDTNAYAAGNVATWGFNSPFGILFVRTTRRGGSRTENEPFQFPIRNSVRSDARTLRWQNGMRMFQFPIRNSVRSDPPSA